MKKMELLEGIGQVDDELLQECETAKFARKSVTFKVLLVAAIIAMLSITAVAAKLVYQEVSGGEVKPATFKIQTVDSEYNITYEGESNGYILSMEVETFPDVPMKLLYPYLPTVPEDWVRTSVGSGKYDGEVGMFGIEWSYQEDGREYNVFYRQESAYFYSKDENSMVWSMSRVPEEVTVTGETMKLKDVPVYRVAVTAAERDPNYPDYDHYLFFWSDGYSIFQLQVPQYWTEERTYELMCSLTLTNGNLEYALKNLN